MKLVDDIELGLALASALPEAVTLIKTELPTVETELKAAYEAVLTPAEAIIADVELTVKGGAATVVTANAEKTIADLGNLVTALESLIPTLESEGEAEYSKILPVIQPLATTLNIKLPALTATVAANSGTSAASSAT